MRPLNRVEPLGPVQAYKTYGLTAPLSTHYRPATCEEVLCQQHAQGWATTVAADSDDEVFLLKAAAGQVDGLERRFIKRPDAAGFVEYIFPPGQSCFKAVTHKVPLEREPNYLVRDGDWRGNPTGYSFQHTSAESWKDDLATNQDKLINR